MKQSYTPQSIAILAIGSLSLAMPQAEIVSVDVVADARPDESSNAMISASLHRQDGQWPVYAFSDTLKLENSLPDSSRFCVCIRRDDIFYALACDAVEVMQLDVEVPQQELPNIMHTDTTPVLKLMHYQQAIALMTNALSINHYLESLGARDA